MSLHVYQNINVQVRFPRLPIIGPELTLNMIAAMGIIIASKDFTIPGSYDSVDIYAKPDNLAKPAGPSSEELSRSWYHGVGEYFTTLIPYKGLPKEFRASRDAFVLCKASSHTQRMTS